jgi:hypothetical protein
LHVNHARAPCGLYVTLALTHHLVCPLRCGLAVGLSMGGVSALSGNGISLSRFC